MTAEDNQPNEEISPEAKNIYENNLQNLEQNTSNIKKNKATVPNELNEQYENDIISGKKNISIDDSSGDVRLPFSEINKNEPPKSLKTSLEQINRASRSKEHIDVRISQSEVIDNRNISAHRKSFSEVMDSNVESRLSQKKQFSRGHRFSNFNTSGPSFQQSKSLRPDTQVSTSNQSRLIHLEEIENEVQIPQNPRLELMESDEDEVDYRHKKNNITESPFEGSQSNMKMRQTGFKKSSEENRLVNINQLTDSDEDVIVFKSNKSAKKNDESKNRRSQISRPLDYREENFNNSK